MHYKHFVMGPLCLGLLPQIIGKSTSGAGLFLRLSNLRKLLESDIIALFA